MSFETARLMTANEGNEVVQNAAKLKQIEQDGQKDLRELQEKCSNFYQDLNNLGMELIALGKKTEADAGKAIVQLKADIARRDADIARRDGKIKD